MDGGGQPVARKGAMEPAPKRALGRRLWRVSRKLSRPAALGPSTREHHE
jgi:hypothetical protein